MLLWMDGFDHYGNTAALTNGAWANNGSHSVVTDTPRTGAYCMQAATSDFARRVLGKSVTAAGMGMGIRLPTLPSDNDRCGPICFLDGAATTLVSVVIQTTGAIAIKRGSPNGGTVLATSTALITAGSWFHLEARAVISDTVGSVEVRLNGETIVTVSGVDTNPASGLGEISQIAIGNNTPGLAFRYDDVFVWDTTGTDNNDFFGDRRVFTLMPTANGALDEWAKSSGTSAFDLLDEVPADGDTSYIYAAAADAQTSITFGDLPADIITVSGVQTVLQAKKTEAGTCNVKLGVISDGDTLEGDDHAIGVSYGYIHDVFELDPATGEAWLPAAVNDVAMLIDRTA